MKRQYYSMEKVGNEANINIYGDISAYSDGENANIRSLAKVLEEMTDVKRLNVYINSYGGEVAEGLAIYNALKRHKAKVRTICDGFACSIASVIFMAGDERIMNDSSLLMIHNAWSLGMGNAEQLRKQADDLDKITEASVVAYQTHSNLSGEEIRDLMDKESWILPEEALEYGFATHIEKTENKAASQNAKMQLLGIIAMFRQKTDKEEAETDEEEKPKTNEETETEDKENPEDEENTEGEDETEDETDTEDSEEEPKAEQKFNNFLNAILKI